MSGVDHAASATGFHRWRLWSTYAFLAVDEPALLDRARTLADQVLAEVEQGVSRFRPDSDLVRANARAGTWTPVGAPLVAAVRAAVHAAEVTGGLVDPTLGSALVTLGYDDDIDVVRRRTPALRAVVPLIRRDAWRAVEVTDDAVKVPAGTTLDLGATAKAWAADVVAATVSTELGCQSVVSLGGDVRVHDAPGAVPTPWPVRVAETPDGADGADGADGTVVWLTGGLATSSTLVRRWQGPRGTVVHHVIDPRTGQPAQEVHRTVSCVGADALGANIASTAALVLGHDAAAWLARHDVAARLVAADGTVQRTGAWPEPHPHDAEQHQHHQQEMHHTGDERESAGSAGSSDREN